MITDPYSVLGVPSSASDDEVKKAYRELHPEVSSGFLCEQSAFSIWRRRSLKKCRKLMTRL